MSDRGQTKEAIRDWWAGNPMTYANEHGTTVYVDDQGTEHQVKIGSRQFYELADQRFLEWNQPLHTTETPFARLFPYQKYRDKSVLEIGCGVGFMSMNWAMQGARMTSVDLNPVAVQQTKHRFRVFELPGNVMQSDAENLPFRDKRFDYIYSWGVLHHTPGIQKALKQVHRILRPGGEVGVMLYHRRSFKYLHSIAYLEGFMHLENEFLTPLQLGSRYTDGSAREGNPHTWPVTKDEVRKQLFADFSDVRIKVLGTDVAGHLDLFSPGLGSFLMPKPLLKALARRWGWSLWITARKDG